MEGINIINEYVCRGITIASIIFILVLWASAVAFLIHAACGMFTGKERIKAISFVLFLFIGLFVFSAYMIYAEYEDQWLEYDVTISDSVPYNEFVGKYEVIRSDGTVLRVKEK